jgi:hypothetical protein
LVVLVCGVPPAAHTDERSARIGVRLGVVRSISQYSEADLRDTTEGSTGEVIEADGAVRGGPELSLHAFGMLERFGDAWTNSVAMHQWLISAGALARVHRRGAFAGIGFGLDELHAAVPITIELPGGGTLAPAPSSWTIGVTTCVELGYSPRTASRFSPEIAAVASIDWFRNQGLDELAPDHRIALELVVGLRY